MKSPFALLLFIVFLSVSCKQKDTGENQQALVDASRQELVEALEERDQLLNLVKEISLSVDQIKHLEKVMSLTGTQGQENPEAHARLIADIKEVKRTLQIRREQLAVLEEKLRESGLYNDELQSVIDVLRNRMESQSAEIDQLRRQLTLANETIGDLSTRVDSLNTTVLTVSSELDEAQAMSNSLEAELNECFYVAATKSELKKHNIVETGFLRKTKILKGNFDRDFFTAADRRTLDKIELHSSKCNVLTGQPSSSYEIVDSDGGKMLVIKDSEAFWRTTNYLVIQVD